MNYEERLIESEKYNLIIKEKDLKAHDGRIYGNRIAIRKDMTQAEKNCALAEELAHYKTNVTDIISTNDIREEYKARICAYNDAIGLNGIILCYKHRIKSRHDMAEFLDVSEQFLNEAIDFYKRKYGVSTTIGHYVIGFEPSLYVMEKVLNLDNEIA